MSHGRLWYAILLYSFAFANFGYPSSIQQDTTISPDQAATFQLIISLTVKPETPTSYDRTWIAIESSPQMNFEIVEIKDETRGITTKYRGSAVTLETLFGPKNGLTDKIVVSALVRIPRQSGEKIVRKTIRLRNVPPEIWHNAERRGRVRIDVQLDLSTKWQSAEGRDNAAARQDAILNAQDELVISLAGTDYKFLRTFESEGGFLLEAGPTALAVLDRLPNVIKIKEDVSFRLLAQ